MPRDSRFNDGALVTTDVGQYLPNAWGLYDMHGNAAEWTRTTYRSYPYKLDDGRETISNRGQKVVRGGSWRDRPKRCRSAFRLAYPAYQKVYNVSFRVIIEPDEKRWRQLENKHFSEWAALSWENNSRTCNPAGSTTLEP